MSYKNSEIPIGVKFYYYHFMEKFMNIAADILTIKYFHLKTLFKKMQDTTKMYISLPSAHLFNKSENQRITQ